MNLPDELLSLLVCPETQSRLRPATRDQLATLNQAALAGELVDRKGATISGRLDAALVRADGEVAYPVQDGIVALVSHSGVVGQFGKSS